MHPAIHDGAGERKRLETAEVHTAVDPCLSMWSENRAQEKEHERGQLPLEQCGERHSQGRNESHDGSLK